MIEKMKAGSKNKITFSIFQKNPSFQELGTKISPYITKVRVLFVLVTSVPIRTLKLSNIGAEH